jgi:hypothetical protein
LKYLGGLLLALLFAMPASVAYATDTNIVLQILPLECSFDIVNDGNNTIHYITPVACGQALPPSDNPTAGPTIIQGEQPTQPRSFLSAQKNSIQETAPTIIDNGTEIIGIPSSTPKSDSKLPNPSQPNRIFVIILVVILIIALTLVLIANIIGFALIASIVQASIRIAAFFRTIIKTILGGSIRNK